MFVCVWLLKRFWAYLSVLSSFSWRPWHLCWYRSVREWKARIRDSFSTGSGQSEVKTSSGTFPGLARLSAGLLYFWGRQCDLLDVSDTVVISHLKLSRCLSSWNRSLTSTRAEESYLRVKVIDLLLQSRAVCVQFCANVVLLLLRRLYLPIQVNKKRKLEWYKGNGVQNNN